jgi:purine-cytosine permease-like protein
MTTTRTGEHRAGPPDLKISYNDDPDVLARAASEDYSMHIVPRSWRNGPKSVAMAWFGLMSAMFFVVVGATVALAVGTINSLIGIGLSVVAYGVINGIAAKVANESGTSVSQFSRAMFGRIGSAFAAALFGLTIVYYTVAEGAIVASALHAFFAERGWVAPMAVWFLIVVIYQAPMAWRGVTTWLDRLNGFLLPLYVLGLFGSVIWAIAVYGYSNDWLTPAPEAAAELGVPGWWYAFVIYMGVWVVTMMAWDFARYGRPEDADHNARTSFGIPFHLVTLLVNAVVGMFLVETIEIDGPVSEESAIIGVVGMMGIWGLLWVIASQTRVNAGNFYLSSTNLQNFFARSFKWSMPRVFWLGVVAVVVYLMMLTNVLTWISISLQYQGALIVGWVAIMLVHVGRMKLKGIPYSSVEIRPGRVPAVNPAGTGAWVVSAAVGVIMVASGGNAGAVWAPPVAFVLAGVLYAVALRFANPSWHTMDRPLDPRDEVDDPWEARVECHRCGDAYIAFEMDRDPSHNHAAICMACASDNPDFLKAADLEAKELRKERVDNA